MAVYHLVTPETSLEFDKMTTEKGYNLLSSWIFDKDFVTVWNIKCVELSILNIIFY